MAKTATATVTAANTPLREYETIYIMKPDVTRERAGRVSSRIQELMGREGGRLTLVESWGRRRLSYPVSGNKDGVYIYVKYVGLGNVVNELERNLRMLDDVMKYLTVRTQETLDAEAPGAAAENATFDELELEPYVAPAESRERLLGLDESARVSERPSRDADDVDDGPREEEGAEEE
jgi:small subunit ribosomal protein S6